MKHHLKGNGLDIDGIRIDVTSNALAQLKSFRLIAPIAMEDEALSPDMWPCGVRVEEHIQPRDNQHNTRYKNNY